MMRQTGVRSSGICGCVPGMGRTVPGACQSEPELARKSMRRATSAKKTSASRDWDPEQTSIASPPAYLKALRNSSSIQDSLKL